MTTRTIGRSGIAVSPLCFGGNVFGWTVDEATSFRILDAFVDAGFNFVDTADVYSRWVPGHQGGESETILGKWFVRSGKRTAWCSPQPRGFEPATETTTPEVALTPTRIYLWPVVNFFKFEKIIPNHHEQGLRLQIPWRLWASVSERQSTLEAGRICR